MTIIAPSILSCDFANAGRDLGQIKASGAPWVHLDVMDGSFVPNFSLGMAEISCLRRVSDLFFDVHLMIEKPIRYVERFCKAGADLVTVHVEADTPENIHKTLAAIHAQGKKAGISVKPGTPAEVLTEFLTEVELILVMTVEPGFGGQSFMEHMMPKLKRLQQLCADVNPGCYLEVDGGIDKTTAAIVKANGANVLVSGSKFFNAPDKAAFVAEITA